MKTKDLIDILLNSISKYDLVGDYDLYIDKQCDGDYFKVDDVEELLNKLLNNEK